MDPLKENLIISRAEHCWLSKNEWKVPPLPNTDWLFFTPLPWSQYCRGTVIFEVKNILGGYLYKEKKIGRRRIIAYLFPNFWSPLLRVFGDNIVQRKILWKYCTEEILVKRHVMYLRIPGFNKNYGKYPKIPTIVLLKWLFMLHILNNVGPAKLGTI